MAFIVDDFEHCIADFLPIFNEIEMTRFGTEGDSVDDFFIINLADMAKIIEKYIPFENENLERIMITLQFDLVSNNECFLL